MSAYAFYQLWCWLYLLSVLYHIINFSSSALLRVEADSDRLGVIFLWPAVSSLLWSVCLSLLIILSELISAINLCVFMSFILLIKPGRINSSYLNVYTIYTMKNIVFHTHNFILLTVKFTDSKGIEDTFLVRMCLFFLHWCGDDLWEGGKLCNVETFPQMYTMYLNFIKLEIVCEGSQNS